MRNQEENISGAVDISTEALSLARENAEILEARESDIKRWLATGENAGIITELERYTKDPKKYFDQAVELEKTNRAKVKEISDALKDLEKMPRDRKRLSFVDEL